MAERRTSSNGRYKKFYNETSSEGSWLNSSGEESPLYGKIFVKRSSSCENPCQNLNCQTESTKIDELTQSIKELSKKISQLLDNPSNVINNPRKCTKSTRKARFTFKDVEESLDFFDGDENQDIVEWLTEYEEQASVFEWDDEEKLVYARRLLKGSAKLFVKNDLRPKTWYDLKRGLKREFAEEINTMKVHQKLSRTKKRNSETYNEFCYRMLRIAAPARLRDKELISYIVEAVGETTDAKLFLSEASSMDELKEKLKVYEDYKKKESYKNNRKELGRPSGSKGNSNQDGKDQDFNGKQNRLCFKCGLPGHFHHCCPNEAKKSVNIIQNIEEDDEIKVKQSEDEEESSELWDLTMKENKILKNFVYGHRN